MRDRLRFRFDLAICGFFFAGLLASVSVFSYDPADLPAPTVFPPPRAPANVLGAAGAWTAYLLVDTLGVAVYAFLASWFVLVVLLFLRRRWLMWMLRLAGWLLLVPCAAVLADSLEPGAWGGSLSGGGGRLGAWLALWLRENFDPVGRTIVQSACVALGLILTADSLLVNAVAASWRGARWLWKTVQSVRPRPRRAVPPVAPALPRTGEGAAADGIPIRYPDQPTGSPPASPPTRAEAAARPTPAVVPVRRPAPAEGEDPFAAYELPPLSLLEDSAAFPYEEHDQRLRERAAVLEKTFTDFGLNVRVVGINTGPVITQFEVALETGLRVHKVTRLADDLALNLKVPSVRMVAPIPGKNTVGVEIPNERRAVVCLKEVIRLAGAWTARAKIPLFLGKDTEGRPLVYDLAEMPHLLIAGRTGTGKSVCMNAIILSMLMTRRPDVVKMIMIDPKMLELSEYGKIPHLMHPVVKDMKKAEAILSWAVDKMEERYELLSRARVRSIAGYNELAFEEVLRRVQPDDEERVRLPVRMPYIVIFVDEMNDLMMTMKKEVEGHIIRLAQKSRAAGIHLVVATQKPTVDVITGLIKSNLPARICFQVSSRSDSRVVLDEMGADKLLGKGDMLFLQPGTSTLLRAQGTYAGDEEISRVVGHLECDPCYAQELVQLRPGGAREDAGGFLAGLRARDELYEQAIEVLVREGRGSVSLLQRALGIGYGRAARLVDFMAEDGIVGDYNGSQAREVLFTPEQWEQIKQTGQAPEARARSGTA
jgi:S-DNA-T family DNA segregation ATPase FtsK/SpoIIIE